MEGKLTLRVTKIHRWHHEYEWLSNNYLSPVSHGGDWYPSVSHAFLASKTPDQVLRNHIAVASIAELDGLWDVVGKAPSTWHGSTIMKDLIETKFGLYTSGQPKDFLTPMFLLKKLVNTGGAALVFGNNLHDNYWGQCLCGKGDCNQQGKNLLGYIMMGTRDRINKRIQVYGDGSDYCVCGEIAEQTLLYTKGWIPKLRSYCKSTACAAEALVAVRSASSDGFIFSYPPNGMVEMEMPPLNESKPVNEIKKVIKVTTNNDDDDDDYNPGFNCGYNEFGVWMGSGYKPTVTPERKYETLVIQGK